MHRDFLYSQHHHHSSKSLPTPLLSPCPTSTSARLLSPLPALVAFSLLCLPFSLPPPTYLRTLSTTLHTVINEESHFLLSPPLLARFLSPFYPSVSALPLHPSAPCALLHTIITKLQLLSYLRTRPPASLLHPCKKSLRRERFPFPNNLLFYLIHSRIPLMMVLILVSNFYLSPCRCSLVQSRY